jgi:hypothetical protein
VSAFSRSKRHTTYVTTALESCPPILSTTLGASVSPAQRQAMVPSPAPPVGASVAILRDAWKLPTRLSSCPCATDAISSIPAASSDVTDDRRRDLIGG